MFHVVSLAVFMVIHLLFKEIHDITAPIERPCFQKAYRRGGGGWGRQGLLGVQSCESHCGRQLYELIHTTDRK